MIFAINPTKDASVYSADPTMNTGLDEVLEVSKVWTTATTRAITRALVQFDVTAFPLGTSTVGNRKFFLKLYATEPENLQSNYTIQVLPVTASWTMGSGKLFNTPATTEGVSWDFKNTLTTDTGSSEWWYASASVGMHSLDNGGAYNASPFATCTQSFTYTTADTNIDVTSMIEAWIAGTQPNNGMLVMFGAGAEGIADTTSYGTLKFFSKDSNTVYKPKLILKYDDSTRYVSASVAGTLNADDTVVYIKGQKPQYAVGAIDKIRVIARDRFPVKTFSVTQSQYISYNYLPTASYYGVKDAYTGEMVVDYDSQYGKVSSDENGNFFTFNFGTLFVGRLYKFMLKVERGSLTQFFDTDTYFKVTR